MSDFNTFTGKTVDDAINEACRFFSTQRDKLEVEIITGGSTGIFGLVGKKKAQIRAKRRQDPAMAARMLEEEQAEQPQTPAKGGKGDAAARAEKPEAQADAPAGSPAESFMGSPVDAPAQAAQSEAQAVPAGEETSAAGQRPPRERGRGRDGRQPRAPRAPREASKEASKDGAKEGKDAAKEAREPREPRGERSGRGRDSRRDKPRAEAQPRPKAEPRGEPRSGARADALDEDLPEVQDDTPASQELLDITREIMLKLLTPILEVEPVMEIGGTAGRINVTINDEEHSGLLIGREGQTLASLQYLANRILARRWETPVRVQINTGEYREKQDDNLRKMALYLADKAKNLGRPQSTKPLSSYHRRVIHLTLQADETIQTRSKGDGPMKRVIIVPKRPKAAEAQPAQ